MLRHTNTFKMIMKATALYCREGGKGRRREEREGEGGEGGREEREGGREGGKREGRREGGREERSVDECGEGSCYACVREGSMKECTRAQECTPNMMST